MRYEELLVRVQKDYPELNFRAGKRFCYRPLRMVVYEQFCESTDFETGGSMKSEQKNDSSLLSGVAEAMVIEHKNNDSRLVQGYKLQLLHEVGHALLGHRGFRTDVDRVKMECAAWIKARELCDKYGVEYDENFVEGELDTYRDWLYRKAKCSECGMTRYQDNRGKYRCPICEEFENVSSSDL